MKQQARRDHICEVIRRKGSCLIKELADEMHVSEMTVRRDLDALAERGLVIRTHGGASMARRISFEFEFLNRINSNRRAKEAIAATAATLVSDNQSLMISSGTTTLALARRLRDVRGLTVITTSLPIAAELQYHEKVQVLLLGGHLRAAVADVSGALTELSVDQVRANIAFLGCDAVDNEGHLFSTSPEVARLLTQMAEASSEVYVLADSSKIGRTALCRYGEIPNLRGLVTDENVPPETLASLRRIGINVITARMAP